MCVCVFMCMCVYNNRIFKKGGGNTFEKVRELCGRMWRKETEGETFVTIIISKNKNKIRTS